MTSCLNSVNFRMYLWMNYNELRIFRMYLYGFKDELISKDVHILMYKV